jgi:cytochrome P450
MDSTLFPNPEKFDASRFEGEGPTPYSYGYSCSPFTIFPPFFGCF